MSYQLSLLEQLKEAGIKQALDHADAEEPGWSDKAYDHLISYINKVDEPFQTEQVRAFAEDRGLPKPPDNRAWGGVIQKAVKRNIIKGIGFAPTKNPISHGRPMVIWTSKNK